MRVRVAPVLILIFIARKRLLRVLDRLGPHPAQVNPILRVRRLVVRAETVLTTLSIGCLKVPPLL